MTKTELKNKLRKGIISNSTAITIALAVIAWLFVQVYTDINNRVVDVEQITQQDHTAVASIQTDIKWIKLSLQARGFSPSSSTDITQK